MGRIGWNGKGLPILAAARTPEEEFELFGEDFYSDVLNYKDSKDEELSFMDELESSLY